MISRVIVEIGVIALALATAVALFALFDVPQDTSDLIFATIMLWCAVGVLRLVWNAGCRARAERRTAQRLEATTLGQAARDAVIEERVRIAADVEAVVRASVTRMGRSADEADRVWQVDPAGPLLAVQDEGAHAGSELRRMLGLLREADRPPADPPRMDRSAGHRAARHLPPAALLLCVGSVALTIFERYPQPPGVPAAFYSAGAVVLTALAATTVVLFRRAPALGAALCGGFFVLGAVRGAPVGPGSWIFLTPVVLAWAAATGTWSGLLAVIALLAGVTLDLGWYLPVNLPICLVIIGISALGGAAVGRSNRRKASAHDRVVRRSSELTAATGAAVSAERLAVARDLHDVVSHAIAVMVMQAGAANALRGTDPDRARAALTVVGRTASETVGELDHLVDAIAAGALGIPSSVPGAVERDSADLTALVHRMEGAGLRIALHLNGRLTGNTGAAVYRITQEALTNALRHALGAQVTVIINMSRDRVTVDVHDDGPGATPEIGRGYGLVGIAERVERLGGQVTIGACGNRSGFRISARIPAVEAVPT